MAHSILLVDDNRDILKLLRVTLDSLKNPNIKIFEAPSGEEAMLESSNNKIDLLITDYLLPGMTGVELMHKIRARNPDVKVILITGMSERKARDQMLNAGALAIFDKPIPLADFLDAVERGLGLVQTIFPPEKLEKGTEERHTRLSDLLANFRQDFSAQAVFLINDRGLVQARAGGLRDSSFEVSIISSLMAIHHASLKVAKYNHQESIDSYHIFGGGDNDLIFIPVNPLYALMVAGSGLAAQDRIFETVNGFLALRKEVEKGLKSIGATGELKSVEETAKTEPAIKAKVNTADAKVASEPVVDKQAEAMKAAPSAEMEAILKAAAQKKATSKDMDDFWSQAAEQSAKKPANSNVITLDQAREMGLLPDDGKK